MIEVETEAEKDFCITLPAPSAVKTVKFHSGQAGIDRYTAVTVLNKGETKTEITGNHQEETSAGQILRKGDHIRQIAGEMYEAETADN